jgi:hypothetical protein
MVTDGRHAYRCQRVLHTNYMYIHGFVKLNAHTCLFSQFHVAVWHTFWNRSNIFPDAGVFVAERPSQLTRFGRSLTRFMKFHQCPWPAGIGKINHGFLRVIPVITLFCHSFSHTIWKYIPFFSDILFGILSGIYSDILSGIYFDIISNILSGIYSDILSDIFSGIHSGILSGSCSDILSDILSGIQIWHLFWHSFWHSIWHSLWRLAQVRQCPLRSDFRSCSALRSGAHGWGPTVPTDLWSLWLRTRRRRGEEEKMWESLW